MNVAVVDDIREEVEPLILYLKEYSVINDLELSIDEFDKAEDFLMAFRPFRYTAVFLDIFMEGMNGVEAAQEIRKRDSDTFILFLTSSLEYMPEAFSIHAYEYMEKPVVRERVFKAFDDILNRTTDPGANKLLKFMSNRCDVQIPYSRIVTVIADGNRQEIEDKDGAVYKTRTGFNELWDTLGKDGRFLMVSRGMIVNMDHIMNFEKGVCCIINSIRIPISQKNQPEAEETWRNYVFHKLRNEHRGVTL